VAGAIRFSMRFCGNCNAETMHKGQNVGLMCIHCGTLYTIPGTTHDVDAGYRRILAVDMRSGAPLRGKSRSAMTVRHDKKRK
jgi:hypothetical protein